MLKPKPPQPDKLRTSEAQREVLKDVWAPQPKVDWNFEGRNPELRSKPGIVSPLPVSLIQLQLMQLFVSHSCRDFPSAAAAATWRPTPALLLWVTRQRPKARGHRSQTFYLRIISAFSRPRSQLHRHRSRNRWYGFPVIIDVQMTCLLWAF